MTRSSLMIKCIFALLIIFYDHQKTLGAEITPVSEFSALTIEGKIEPGDCDKIAESLQSERAMKIFLASTGGDLRESMLIGRLVRKLKLFTFIPGYFSAEITKSEAKAWKVKDSDHNMMCASACFFIFVAGIERNFDGPFGRPILGIHRPYLSEFELSKMSGDQAISSAKAIREVVDTYLREMGVPHKYLDKMFSIPSDEIRWIDAEDFSVDLEGLIPDLREWMKSKINSKLEEIKKRLEDNKSRASSDWAKNLNEEFDPEDARLLRIFSDPLAAKINIEAELANDAWWDASSKLHREMSNLCNVLKE